MPSPTTLKAQLDPVPGPYITSAVQPWASFPWPFPRHTRRCGVLVHRVPNAGLMEAPPLSLPPALTVWFVQHRAVVRGGE